MNPSSEVALDDIFASMGIGVLVNETGQFSNKGE